MDRRLEAARDAVHFAADRPSAPRDGRPCDPRRAADGPRSRGAHAEGAPVLKRTLRVFLAPGIFLVACMVADVALRHQAYGERLGYLYYRAGILKVVAAY